MLDVLKVEPGVQAPELTLRNTKGGVTPCLKYQYLNEYREFESVCFCASHDPRTDRDQFVIVLRGIYPEGGPEPTDLGTHKLAPKWEKQCGAHLVVLMD